MKENAQPVPRALVLYGRVGTYITRTASLRKGMPGDVKLWRTCAESIQTHVLRPWLAAGPVDVFVQSWNLELADAMDNFWQPRASFHGAQNTSLGKCPIRLNYCDRTMWALLGMKKALALRSAWAASGALSGKGQQQAHATVLVMRHDVIWSSPLPPLRADRAVRLWLPFDCHRASCRDSAARAADLYAEAPAALSPRPSRESCSERKNAPPSNWTLVHAPRNVLGVNCAPGGTARAQAFCGNSVNIDWWWAGDVALADGFGSTYDKFGDYSRLIKEYLSFHNSAPHHYWGLYFFHTHRLRERCQLGHAGVSGIDFTLGRFVPSGSVMPSCRLHGWRAYWKPPTAAKAHSGSGSTSTSTSPSGDRAAVSPGGAGTGTGTSVCNASLIPGYLTMCPGTPSHPVRKVCESQPVAPNPEALRNRTGGLERRRIQKLQKRGGDGDSDGGGKGNGGGKGHSGVKGNGGKGYGIKGVGAKGNGTNGVSGVNATRRFKGVGTGKGAREALRELTALKDEHLISEAEWKTLRAKILDALVAKAAPGAGTAAAR